MMKNQTEYGQEETTIMIDERDTKATTSRLPNTGTNLYAIEDMANL